MRICQGVYIPMTKIKSVLKILIPLFSAIIGLNLMDKYNIFVEWNIGPQDKASGVQKILSKIIDLLNDKSGGNSHEN